MKNSLTIIFCVILTACTILEKHPQLEKELKEVEKEAIDFAAQDAKDYIDGHGDDKSPSPINPSNSAE